mgnify:FL=1
MSRVGSKPVEIPEKVNVSVHERRLEVEGPLGKLDAILPRGVEVKLEDGQADVTPPKPNRANRGYQGLTRSLLANMVQGVTKGYERNLEVMGVGYKAELKGRTLTLTVGYSHTIDYTLPEGVEAEVDKGQTKVKIKGINKQLVGQTAAQIRGFKVPEPYKGKGIKYAEETLQRKEGKAGGKK